MRLPQRLPHGLSGTMATEKQASPNAWLTTSRSTRRSFERTVNPHRVAALGLASNFTALFTFTKPIAPPRRAKPSVWLDGERQHNDLMSEFNPRTKCRQCDPDADGRETLHGIEQSPGKTQPVGEREGRDDLHQFPKAQRRDNQRGHEKQMVIASEDMHDTMTQVFPECAPAIDRRTLCAPLPC